MKNISFLTFLFFLVLNPAVHAQKDTAYHRKVYADINDNLESYKEAKATFKDEPLVIQLKGWFDGDEPKKIVAAAEGEDGDGFEEYYFDGDELVFVYRTYKMADPDTGDYTDKVEDRFYFQDGALFKWLDTDKKPIDPDEDMFASEGELLASNADIYRESFARKGGAKAKPVQFAEGKFMGIEEGDYFHWMMKNGDGEEISFFILRGDDSVSEVLDDPEAYVGKKCRVSWKSSLEEIPEAGGKMEIEQILSVEWLK